MVLLITGMVLFLLAHSVPMFPQRRTVLIGRWGENGYKGIIGAISLVALVLIVLGMRHDEFIHLYMPPAWGRMAPHLLMLPALFCFLAFGAPSNLKRITAHPMLWGVTLWALGHLLANGDAASLVLFGGFGGYALVDMASANRRGARPLGEKVPWSRDIILLLAALVLYAVLMKSHGFIAGIPLM